LAHWSYFIYTFFIEDLLEGEEMKKKHGKVWWSVIIGAALTVLRVIGIIHWSWFIVLLPFYWPIPVAAGLLVIAACGIPTSDTLRKLFGIKTTFITKK
jgi:membrane protein YdbS with pleckstrin-like domain